MLTTGIIGPVNEFYLPKQSLGLLRPFGISFLPATLRSALRLGRSNRPTGPHQLNNASVHLSMRLEPFRRNRHTAKWTHYSIACAIFRLWLKGAHTRHSHALILKRKPVIAMRKAVSSRPTRRESGETQNDLTDYAAPGRSLFFWFRLGYYKYVSPNGPFRRRA